MFRFGSSHGALHNASRIAFVLAASGIGFASAASVASAGPLDDSRAWLVNVPSPPDSTTPTPPIREVNTPPVDVEIPPVGNPSDRVCVEDGLQSVRARGAASATIHETVEPAVDSLSNDLGDTVHSVNCTVVVPAEDVVDSMVNTASAYLRRLAP